MRRGRVRPRTDRRVFIKTANKTDVKNVPGKHLSRGGTRL